MSSIKALQQHYLRIIRLWPQDTLRSLTVRTALRRRLDAKFPPTPAATAATATPVPDSAHELGQINALYSLLDNRYAKQYPASDVMMHPPSNPIYYAELAAEMEIAPKRSWLAKKWVRLSKVVRFS